MARRIAVIGGTGALGLGLVARWALAGESVVIGSRRQEAAQVAASDLTTQLAGRKPVLVEGMENARAAEMGDVVVLTVPYAHHADMIDTIRDAVRGKVLVDTTVPLVPPRVGTVQLPAAGCAALEAQKLVDASTSVVSAFQNVAADKLRSLESIDCDVLVSGDSKDAREVVADLVRAAGMRPFHAVSLANAAAAEALTSVLITLNRQFKCQAGIRITGIP
jgi:NADPH-dependent F420 reductase